jgi:hypothetical protein
MNIEDILHLRERWNTTEIYLPLRTSIMQDVHYLDHAKSGIWTIQLIAWVRIYLKECALQLALHPTTDALHQQN